MHLTMEKALIGKYNADAVIISFIFLWIQVKGLIYLIIYIP